MLQDGIDTGELLTFQNFSSGSKVEGHKVDTVPEIVPSSF